MEEESEGESAGEAISASTVSSVYASFHSAGANTEWILLGYHHISS